MDENLTPRHIHNPKIFLFHKIKVSKYGEFDADFKYVKKYIILHDFGESVGL